MKNVKFLVVMAVPNHLDDWEVTGVFSNDRDAAEFTASAKSSGEFRAVADPQRMPMDAILDVLVRDRLASLAEPILKLASSGAQGTQGTQGTPAASYPRSALRDAFRLAGLIQLCGSVQGGTGTTVKLSQDDATGCWVLMVVGQKGFTGDSPREVIDAAIEFNKENLP